MAFTPNLDIYTEFYQQLTLTDKNREELKVKRGFTDATIETLGFKSAIPANADIINGMAEKHGMKAVFECGLIDSATRKPAWQFTNDDMVIIPYLNTNDVVYLFKSHKFGNMKNSPVMPYCNKVFAVQSDTVVLCESEYKAAAMFQMGHRALGLGGVATFAGKHIGAVADLLRNCKRVIVLFDTEIQDDPSLSNFKDSYKKRYAQYVWSYVMAKKLHNYLNDEQMRCQVDIASLPDEWMIDGKADIDGCVAAGRTKEEFDMILHNALSPESYKDWIRVDPKHKPWIMRRMQSAFKTNVVFEEDNCLYTYVKGKKGEPATTKQVSNFRIGLLSTTKYKGKIYRDIQLVNEFGDRSKSFHLESTTFANVNSFKEACLGTGDFLWRGNDTDFNNVVQALFLETEANPIDLLDYAGRSEECKAWLYSNYMIFDDGEIVPHNKENDAFARDDKLYRVQWQGSDDSSRIRLSDKDIDINDVIAKLRGAWGTPGVIALGYAVATLFANPYFEHYKCFPIGLFHGEASSGKSTLSDVIALILGFPLNNPSMNISNTTQVAMARKLAFYSSLPVRFDEHRQGDRKIEDKYSILRSFYNRQNSAKGTRFGQTQTFEVDVRGSCIIIGEQKPGDYALLTRCVPVYLSKSDKSLETLRIAHDLLVMGESLSNITFKLLKNYVKNAEMFMRNCHDTREGLAKMNNIQDINFRAMQHFAAVLAGLSIVMTPEALEACKDDVIKTYFNYVEQQSKETVLLTFLEDLMIMKIDGEPTSNYAWHDIASNVGVIYLPGLYQLWAKWKKVRSNSHTPVPVTTINQYLTSQPCFLKRSKRRLAGNKGEAAQRLNVMEFSISTSMPESLRVLFGNPLIEDGGDDEESNGSDKPERQPGEEEFDFHPVQ